MSKKVSLVVTCVHHRVLHLVEEAGQGVEALACGGAFVKVKFKSWTGRLTTHAVVSKSRSCALVFCLDVVA